MKAGFEDLIKKVYTAFNARDIDGVLVEFAPDVYWPNGWEGGYVNGHEEVRDYWTRQWKEIDPKVEPIEIKERPDGKIEVDVHQKANDMSGTVIFDSMLKHIYTIENGLIKMMEIEK